MTDGELGKVLKGMTIVVDTREQKNQHILDYLDENKIPYVVEKLDSGDYSFDLPEPFTYLSRTVCVEKKNSLDEITGNFTKGRERFHNEFKRASEANIKMHLVIEKATWKKVVNESYRSQMSASSLTSSLLSFCAEYDLPTWFVGKEESPMLIYNILRIELRKKLKDL